MGHRLRPAWRRLRIEYLEARIVLSFDPSGLEQELFQLVNRFRADPQEELSLLVDRLNPISSSEAYIDQQLRDWAVDGDVLAAQWQQLTPAPPLAWSETAYEAAQVHTQAMIEHDAQEHEFPGEGDAGDRLHDAGYTWRRWAENVYAYPRSVLEAHAGFVIDWGEGPDGIQDPPGHRNNLISTKYVHIGIAIAEVGYDPTREVGPLVVTQDLAAPLVTGDAYVVGAVFQQLGDSPYYVNGQGYGGVSLRFEGPAGRFETASMSAGGYQLALPPGTYRGTASGGGLPATLVSDEFVMGTHNVAIDFRYPDDQELQPSTREDIVATYRDMPVSIAALVNDQHQDDQLDAASLEIVLPPATGVASLSTTQSGVMHYTPAEGALGPDQFFYRVRNMDGVWSQPTRVRILVLDARDRPWHNRWLPEDVNGDDRVSPLDALLVISDLNTWGGRELVVPAPADAYPLPLFDVSGDNRTSPLDALIVIGRLNASQLENGLADGEGESEIAGFTERACCAATVYGASDPAGLPSWPAVLTQESTRFALGATLKHNTGQTVHVFSASSSPGGFATRQRAPLALYGARLFSASPAAARGDANPAESHADRVGDATGCSWHRRTAPVLDARDRLFAQWPEDWIESETLPLDSGPGGP